MSELVHELKSKQYQWIEVDARQEAVDFYKKCYFEIISDPILNENLQVLDTRMVYSII